MKQVYLIDGLKAQLNMDLVLHAIDCMPDNPVYEEFVDEYADIHEELLSMAEPAGILGFGELTDKTATDEYVAGTKVIFAVTSVGDKIKQYSTRAFAEGDYVRGMLADAIADRALFSLEGRMLEKLKSVCGEHGVGILKRLEAPHDIPMEVQREAWESLSLKETLGIDISCGYMFDPVKTSCQVFVISEDADIFKAQHDCRKCPNIDCRYRNIPDDVQGIEITVKKGNEIKKLLYKAGQSVMDLLIENSYYISAVCGGKGRCGKCKVRVLKGVAPVTAEDEKFFNKEELGVGWRLSCLLYPTEDLTVSFELGDESEFVAVSEYEPGDVTVPKERTEFSVVADSCDENAPELKKENKGIADEDKEYHIAIDIGTTTIAMQLLGKTSGDIKHTITTVNSQRKYGADVITRIKASVDGRKPELKECIFKDLKEGIQALLKATGVEMSKVACIAIAGNTTMIHLLMGYDCDSLGIYPFTPVNIDIITGSMEALLGISGDAKVVILPGISTYVGGDIVSGLYACGFDKTEEIKLLVDLGTNGEMALGNEDKLLVTSTAAGPAFEGGNIEWGMGSVAGAICSVELDGAIAKCHTILDKEPVGICGTGVVEAIAELLREDILDDTGLLADEYFDDGFELAKTSDGRDIVLTQKDIRELQLAKSAIRAGIETLLIKYGVSKEQVSKVYLAGGFGYKLNTGKAVAIGMLPKEFADKTQAIGNSSLAGAVKYLREAEDGKALEKIVLISEEISLSTDKDFNEFYMEHMMF
ncbi:MAG: DUF4445 domain-containing protein [Lachnospiraceae bacterium]|nr:DUF4445 domain-containing protein [Lachnospiraceae bacterium]